MQVIKTKKRIVLLWIGFASGFDKLLLKMGLIERKNVHCTIGSSVDEYLDCYK